LSSSSTYPLSSSFCVFVKCLLLIDFYFFNKKQVFNVFIPGVNVFYIYGLVYLGQYSVHSEKFIF